MSNAEPPQRPSFDAFSPSRSPSVRGWGLFIQLALLVIGGFLVFRVIWGIYWASPQQRTAPASVAAEPAAPATPTTVTETSTVVRSPASWNEGQDAVKIDAAKAVQREFLHQGDTLQTVLAQWQADLEKWNQDVVPLLKSDAGKAIAVTPKSIQSFRAIYEQERAPQARLDQLRDLADQLTHGVATAEKEPLNTLAPDSMAAAQLKTFLEEARAAAESYRSANLQIALLLRQAGRQTAVGDKTLEQAIIDQQEAEKLASIESTRKRFERAQQAADERVAAAKEQAIRTAGDIEARKILDAANVARAKQLADEESHQQEQAKAKRLANMQRDMADIRKHLQPFVTKGYAQPGNTDNIQAGDSVPVSLSKLTAFGALKEGREGMEKLMRCATVNNDRQHGAFPQYVGGERGWQETNKEFLKRAQQLLKDYGDLLVEQGLLSP